VWSGPRAVGILIFPKIGKAGFIFGAPGGKGALAVGRRWGLSTRPARRRSGCRRRWCGFGERTVRRVSVRVASSLARAVIWAPAKSIDAIYTLDWRCVEYRRSDLG